MVGTPVAFLAAERFWQGQHFVWFVVPIKALIDAPAPGSAERSARQRCDGRRGAHSGVRGRLAARSAVAPHAHGRGAIAAIPASWWVYTAGTLLIAYSAYFTDSIPRYTMAAFPLFVAFAWKLPRSMEGAVVGVLACLQGVLFVAVLTSAVHPLPIPFLP